MPHRRANGTPGRVDTRDQQQIANPDDCVITEGLAFDFRCDQSRDDVVAGLLAAFRDQLREEFTDDAAVFAAQFRMRLTQLKHALGPFGELVSACRIDVQDRRDDAHRNLLRVVHRRIGFARSFFDDPVDQFVANCLGESAVFFSRLRRE